MGTPTSVRSGLPGRYYLDTSAYLCLLLGEEGSGALEQELQRSQVLSSVLLVLEANRNLIRLSREGLIQPRTLQECLERIERDFDQFLLRDLTLDLCTGRVIPLVSTPHSLDLVHLRTAVWFHQREPLTRFVTLDGPQNQAARELGLPV